MKCNYNHILNCLSIVQNTKTFNLKCFIQFTCTKLDGCQKGGRDNFLNLLQKERGEFPSEKGAFQPWRKLCINNYENNCLSNFKNLPNEFIMNKTKQVNFICLKLTIKTREWHQWCCYDVFIVNFKHIWHLVLVFVLLTLSR